MLSFSLGWRQFRSLWHAGEFKVLLAALVLAVTATTTVSFFTDRINSSLHRQGNILLGADLVISADHPLPDIYLQELQARQIRNSETMEFPSMAINGDKSQLAEIKAVQAGFPLRGDLAVSHQLHGVAKIAMGVPQPGEVWIEPRLANQLQVGVGDSLELGTRQFRVTAILQRESSRGGDLFSIAPRLMMNYADVVSTGLIQYGSRVKYQLLAAAEFSAIRDYASWAKPKLGRGERLEDIESARPEMRSALEKSAQFLGLAAMVGVILSMVAMYLASMPYLQKSLDQYALMRCFGASRQLIVRILLVQTLCLAILGSLLGCLLAYLAQTGLAYLAGVLFMENLPEPGWTPLLGGMVVGLATLLAVLLPALQALSNVPALRVLRRDLEGGAANSALLFGPAALVLALLVLWHAQDWKLAVYTLLALMALCGVIGALGLLSSRYLSYWMNGNFSIWKLGIGNLQRRSGLVVVQVLGFSLGLMALMLLALVRTDLLHNWQASLPANAPNRFIINIQPEQVQAVSEFFLTHGVQTPDIFPMVRGRLVSINQQALDSSRYKNDRARRLAEREFNLSWAQHMQSDNTLLAGRWWQQNEAGQPMLSLEQGIADALNIRLGDKLEYDIAGNRIELTVSSLRKVEWDTMRANFFAVTPPGVLNDYPASYITSLYLPLGKQDALNQLLRKFPNLTVIDVAALMQQVRGVMNKMTYAVEYVFGFTILAGFAVLYAAVVATRDDRVREATLLRVLGASRRQVSLAALSEFLVIGLIASLVAILVANLLAYGVSVKLLSIEYRFNFPLNLQVLAVSSTMVPLAAWLGLRRFLALSPKSLLQSV